MFNGKEIGRGNPGAGGSPETGEGEGGLTTKGAGDVVESGWLGESAKKCRLVENGGSGDREGE